MQFAQEIIPYAIAGASAGAVLGLGWSGAIVFALLNIACRLHSQQKRA